LAARCGSSRLGWSCFNPASLGAAPGVNSSRKVTHHLLRALRGAAADPDDGRVTFAEMANFVLKQGIEPTPGQFVAMWGPTTVLTQPAATDYQRAKPLTQPISVVSCENPLDGHASTLSQLLNRMFPSASPIPRQPSGRPFGQVDRILSILDAKSVGVAEFSSNGVKLIDKTIRFPVDELLPLLEQSRPYVFPVDTVGVGHVASDEHGHRVLLAPVKDGETASLVLAVVGLPPSLLAVGEPLVTVLRAIWNTDIADDPFSAEVRVLSTLRSVYGRLPRSLYERAFDLYRELIDSFHVVFQPIISLAQLPHAVGIHSFEALARRNLSQTRAPVNILQEAHVWGERFIVERDILLLKKAITSYAEADRDRPWDFTKPISINVAVRSLLSETYLDALRESIAEAQLDTRIVTLEISEQDPIRPGPTEDWLGEPLKYFHRRLTKLAHKLGINFAVDDFGVGYSSVARMAELPLTQIKVDRAILHHPLALDELDLVIRIAHHAVGAAPGPRVVIIEGFDVSTRKSCERAWQ